MFLFLGLCAALQTLEGAPVLPPSHLGGSIDTTKALRPWVAECSAPPDDGGQQLRTVYSIVQSCLLTIFACVWKSIHSNIDGPRDSGWTCLKRRLVTMYCALIAPELVFFWALDQRRSAKAIANKYNEEFASFETMGTTTWGKVVGWFQPLPRHTTRHGDGQPWTITHGFFIQMGGFLLYENGYPNEVLNLHRLTQLIRDKVIDAPTVTESDIQDRSKGDTISKAIVVLQTTWFVAQCIARVVQRLPLSELEVVTLAFTVMNAAIYMAWWDKPQGVGKAVCVPLKRTDKTADGITIPLTDADEEARGNPSHPEPADLSQPERKSLNDNQPSIPLHEQQSGGSKTHQHSWLRCMLRKDSDQHDSPFFFLISLPYRVVFSVFRPLVKMGNLYKLNDKQLHTPMFYTENMGDDGPWMAFCVIGIIFGAIHLLAWASEFPSPHDRILWRVSAMIMIVEPLIIPVGAILDDSGAETLSRCCTALFAFGLPLYVASRIILIVIALKAILNPPHNALLDISWTAYIPHL